MGVHLWTEASAGTSKLFCDASTAVDYFDWLTNFLSRRNGCPGCHVETHDGWHAGHVFATSLTVLHKDVDLTGLKPDGGINPDDTPWPVRLKCYWMTFVVPMAVLCFLSGQNTYQRRTTAPREPTARSTDPSLFMSITPWMLRPKYCRPGAKSAAAILWGASGRRGQERMRKTRI